MPRICHGHPRRRAAFRRRGPFSFPTALSVTSPAQVERGAAMNISAGLTQLALPFILLVLLGLIGATQIVAQCIAEPGDDDAE